MSGCDFSPFCWCVICKRATRRFVWNFNLVYMTEQEKRAKNVGITADQYSDFVGDTLSD